MINQEGRWCFLFLIVFLSGCASQIDVKSHVKTWIARPLSELKQAMKSPDSYASKIGWKETSYPLANGNSIYVEPLGEDCAINWQVSPRGTITGYKAVGSGCGQDDPNSFMRALTPPPQ
ncbi:MAG: hypothetical protein QMD07_08160 [Thermodesulfovibrionales bacterium]|nr:hypothetical protein [Thermodesulfovibrionales bacterium]